MAIKTMNTLHSMIGTGEPGYVSLAKFLKSPEVKMLMHDLRHLVQAIVGSVDTLQIALEEHAGDLTYISLDRLRQNTDLAVDILGDLGQAQPAYHKEATGCDVARAIELVVSSLSPLIKQNAVTIRQIMSPPLMAQIRRLDLNRILSNLILNAVEAATGRDTQVTISAKTTPDEFVQITVQDNGCGIDANKLASVFEEGYTTKASQGNKGLGLPAVKQVLETYNGTVRVQSWPDKGTQFVVRIPGTLEAGEVH